MPLVNLSHLTGSAYLDDGLSEQINDNIVTTGNVDVNDPRVLHMRAFQQSTDPDATFDLYERGSSSGFSSLARAAGSAAKALKSLKGSWFGIGKVRPKTLASRPKKRKNKDGKDCLDDEDDPECEPLQLQGLKNGDLTVYTTDALLANATRGSYGAIVGVADEDDLCNSLATLPRDIAEARQIDGQPAHQWLTGYTGSFNDVRNATNREEWREAIGSFRNMSEVLLQSGELPNKHEGLWKGMCAYLETNPDTHQIRGKGDAYTDNGWPVACTVDSNGRLLDQAISYKDTVNAGNDGVAMVEGFDELLKSNTTVQFDGKTATDFVNGVYSQLDEWYNHGKDRSQLLSNFKTYIDVVNDTQALHDNKKIWNSAKTMDYTIHKSDRAKDFALIASYNTEFSGAPRSGPSEIPMTTAVLAALAASGYSYAASGLLSGP